MLSLLTKPQKFLINYLGYLKIKYKVWGGAIATLIMLSVVSLTAVFSLTDTQKEVIDVVEVRQPLAMASLELAETLDKANAALGFYLSSTKDTDKQQYIAALGELDVLLKKLYAMPAVKNDKNSFELIKKIEASLKQYKSYKDEMLVLAVDFQKNFPAIGISGSQMNPVAMEIQASLQSMLLSEAEEEITAQRKQLLLDISELRINWMNIIIGNRAYMAFRGKAALDNLYLYKSVFIDTLKKFVTHEDILTFEQVDALDKVRDSSKNFFVLLDEMVSVHGSEKWRTDSYLISTKIGPLVRNVKQDINTLVTKQRKLSEEISQELVTSTSATKTLVTTLFIIASIIGISGAYILTCMITKPLNETVSTMDDIAKGEGDLTQRIKIKGKDEVALLGKAFNYFISKIHGTVAQVADSTDELTEAANDMMQHVEKAERDIETQRSETEQVISSMSHMHSTVQSVAEHADSAAEVAKEADIQAKKGRDVVEHTINSIESLASEVQDASNVINGLEEGSKDIGTVLDVIKGIAEQTNLLALNAAIEAARAGEQGRGFAVVADEVRNLASRTQESTQEIQTMIERLQQGAHDAVQVMQSGTEKANQSVQKASEAGDALLDITQAVNKIATMNAEIVSVSEEQRRVTDNINNNMANISNVSDTTAQSSKELESSSSSLSDIASKLQTTLNQFQI